jgi:hypothetical protein
LTAAPPWQDLQLPWLTAKPLPAAHWFPSARSMARTEGREVL